MGATPTAWFQNLSKASYFCVCEPFQQLDVQM
jgi:hypothetical protein